MKRTLAGLCLAACMTPSVHAEAAPPNPFVYTCGDYLAAKTDDQRYVANLMTYWIVGYMHGRFADEPRVVLDQAHHDSSVNDIIGALSRICPNVPDLPLASFADNLAGDLQKSLQ